MARAGDNAGQDYEVKQLVIHGNVARAHQMGYTQAVRGPRDSDTIEVLKKVYPESADLVGTGGHPYGNPACCMYLKITDFFRNADGDIGFTVSKETKLLAFSVLSTISGGYNSWYGNGQGRQSANMSVVSAGSATIDGQTISWSAEGNHGFNSSQLWRGFSCNIAGIYVGLIQGTTILTSRRILAYDNSVYRHAWSDYSVADYNDGKDIVIKGNYTTNLDDPVTLIVYVKTQCSCNQDNVNLPVFAENITTYFPDPECYVWRKFGTSKSNDPQGYAIDPDKCDGKWHLVRPFYYKKGTKWRRVEEEDE